VNDLNQVTLTGFIGKPPEMRGGTVLSFSMCVNESFKDKTTGEWKDVPNWVRVIQFGKAATYSMGVIGKGAKVLVSGKLHENVWTDKAGAKHYDIEVVAHVVQPLTVVKREAKPADVPAVPEEWPDENPDIPL
jgi:single-strand DNA-binding protein